MGLRFCVVIRECSQAEIQIKFINVEPFLKNIALRDKARIGGYFRIQCIRLFEVKRFHQKVKA